MPLSITQFNGPQPVTDGGGSLTVDGTVTANAGTGTFAVSAASLPLPAGAATSANQTTLGQQTTKINDGTNTVAVTAASALKVDGSAVTQPVSGTVTANAGTGNFTVVQATASNLNATVAQGLAAALSGYWPVRVTDGANTMPTGDVAARSGFIRITDGTDTAAVVPGSSSPVIGDASLVVQISPNQDPIPTTVVPATSTPGSAVGRASSLTANVFVPVRQTTYVEQTTNAQRSIVSTSANDSAAGTGARTVTIYYLDASGNGPFSETLTLNGLTAVNTVASNICFIERMEVETVGANGSNVGTLNLYTSTGAAGTIFAAIGTGSIASGVGDNQTLYAHHYVPAGFKVKGFYVSVGIIAAAGGGSSVSVIRYRNPTNSNSPWKLASDIINAAQGNSASRVYYVSIQIPGPVAIVGFTTPGNNNSTATLSFDFADEPVV